MCVAVSHGFGKSAVLESEGQIHVGEKASANTPKFAMSSY